MTDVKTSSLNEETDAKIAKALSPEAETVQELREEFDELKTSYSEGLEKFKTQLSELHSDALAHDARAVACDIKLLIAQVEGAIALSKGV
jgi:hypothetical protein